MQRAHVDVIGGIRTGLVLIVLMAVGYQVGLLAEGLSLGIGALFAAIADGADSPGRRLRSMAWGTLWSALGTLIGGLVSGNDVLHIIIGFAVAFACGYAGALGARGGLIGTLTLVLFAVFGGDVIGTGIAFLDFGLVLVGGAAYIVFALAATPFKRIIMGRLTVARAYRAYAEATHRSLLEMTAPTVAVEAMVARTVADHMGVRGATAEWINGFIVDLERTRLALLALLALEGQDEDCAVQLAQASGIVARRIGDSLVGPFSRDVDTPLAALEALTRAAPNERLRVLAEDFVQPLHDAAARLQKPWPIGRRAELSPPRIVNPPVMPRLREHWVAGDPVREHAVRLCVAFGIANLVALLISVPHSYWLPMTVAWVTKPDLSGTVTRVFMRVMGTLVGIVVTTGFVFVADALNLRVIVSILAIGIASYLAIGYIWANYPVAVVGITNFVLMYEFLDGADAESGMVARVAFTVLAGVWVLIVATTRPRRSSLTALDALERTASAIRAYAGAVREGRDPTDARTTVNRERLGALTAVSAAATEPHGLWERPGPHVDPADAAVLLNDALQAASVVVAEELLHERQEDDPALWQSFDATLDDMESRIKALRAG
ncbi:MAG: FUSC family protein [Actinomycetota bacterium]